MTLKYGADEKEYVFKLKKNRNVDRDLLNLIKTQTFHVRFLSEEYKDVDVTGKQYCIDKWIEIHYHLRRHTYSSTELRNRVYQLEKEKIDEKIKKDIQQYSPEVLDKYIQKWQY